MSEGAPPPRSYFDSQLMLQARGFQVATVIDAGAAEGAYFLGRRGRLFTGARHFFIDAMQENEAGYQKLATRFDVGYEIAALAPMEGEVEIRVDPDRYNTHIDRLQPQTAYKKTRRVRMTTLDAVVERHELKPPFLLKLDVQGGELDVLRGAIATLEESVIVTAEIQIFTHRDTLVELLAFMNGNGWALYDLTDPGYYPSDGTFFQCYVTFIPKSMDFRCGTPWVTPDQERSIAAELRERHATLLAMIDEVLR